MQKPLAQAAAAALAAVAIFVAPAYAAEDKTTQVPPQPFPLLLVLS